VIPFDDLPKRLLVDLDLVGDVDEGDSNCDDRCADKRGREQLVVG
jgi:hypothetical protein